MMRSRGGPGGGPPLMLKRRRPHTPLAASQFVRPRFKTGRRLAWYLLVRVAVVGVGSVATLSFVALRRILLDGGSSSRRERPVRVLFPPQKKTALNVPTDSPKEEDDEPPAQETETFAPMIERNLSRFVRELHDVFSGMPKASVAEVWSGYVATAESILLPLEKLPTDSVREDESLFVSVAAYREHRLNDTLTSMFKEASRPELLVAGVISQRCASHCKTGVQVISEKPLKTKIFDAEPDRDGVAEFCEFHNDICHSGRVRVFSLNETEALGPAFARYLASKLWRGETYFAQIDAHVKFATGWDDTIRRELKRTPHFPRSVLSAYPPPTNAGAHWQQKPSSKLCVSEFSKSPAEHKIIRVNAVDNGASTTDYATRQIPFCAAGFFVGRAELLHDVPFDPFLPFVFMGEEIALSARLFTHGWDIYAPSTNVLTHEYRPGRLGLPKFWETTARTFGGRTDFNVRLSSYVIPRVKHVLGYPPASTTTTTTVRGGHHHSPGSSSSDDDAVLAHLDDVRNYALGRRRPLEHFLRFAGIDYDSFTTKTPDWCLRGQSPPADLLVLRDLTNNQTSAMR